MAYIKYYVPIDQPGTHIKDQWVTPGWSDNELESGAVWTNELVHFVVDNGIPLLHDIVDPPGTPSIHEKVIAAAMSQRKERINGRNSRFWGQGLSDRELFRYPWSLASINITTDIKGLIPKKGTKWLFMRSVTTGICDDRMDIDIHLLDTSGDLIAHSHHLAQVVPITAKGRRKNTPGQSAL